MLHPVPSYLYELPIYKKALEIFTLSKRISYHLTDDLAQINDDGTENPDIYFTGDMIQQSNSLAPEILKAELDKDQKYFHIRSLDWTTFRLSNTLKRLEYSNKNAQDFIPILRSELKKFRQLQRSWMLNL